MEDDEKLKVDAYAKLADSAWQRFNSRRGVEWKSSIGIWSAFGAGAVGVFASSATFPWWAFLVVVPIVVAILLIYRLHWLPYIAEAMRRDQLVSYYWESGIQLVVGGKVPSHLEPGAIKGKPTDDLWCRMPTEGNPNPELPPDDKFKDQMRTLHTSQSCQFWIAVLFGLLLFLAMAIRAFTPTDSNPPKLTAEGQFEAEKVKVTR